ncbi:MAG: class I SAM-dependent methyltransferase [Sedimenticola sp.]
MALNQTENPSLWFIFQYLFGGTVDKRKLCLKHFKGRGRVLEIGCSLGNISSVFIKHNNVDFLGIDIDKAAIEYVSRSFSSHSNVEFLCMDFLEFAKSSTNFDYILFAGSLHHMDDNLCHNMLHSAESVVDDNGLIVVVDPLLPRLDDPWFVREFIKLEQGEHLRTAQQMDDLVNSIDCLSIIHRDEVLIGATPLGAPLCARFIVYVFKKK